MTQAFDVECGYEAGDVVTDFWYRTMRDSFTADMLVVEQRDLCNQIADHCTDRGWVLHAVGWRRVAEVGLLFRTPLRCDDWDMFAVLDLVLWPLYYELRHWQDTYNCHATAGSCWPSRNPGTVELDSLTRAAATEKSYATRVALTAAMFAQRLVEKDPPGVWVD